MNLHGYEGKKEVAFAPQIAMKAQKGVQEQLYPFFNLGARWV